MPNNTTVQDIAVCACAGCGARSDQKKLRKLFTYSRSFACLECYVKYRSCSNCNCKEHLGPRGQCHCGCINYRHGLEHEFDRQLANAVGQQASLQYCQGVGGKPCGRVVIVKPGGIQGRLCAEHEHEWMQATADTLGEMWATMEDQEGKTIQ